MLNSYFVSIILNFYLVKWDFKEYKNNQKLIWALKDYDVEN